MKNLPVRIGCKTPEPRKIDDLLKSWFLSARRDLPWRQAPTPYAVWVSEVMLQQTQVSVVIGYFQRWMERFPTVKHVAEASLEEVIKLWEGLGYYSRARSLHKGAQYILEHHAGNLPSSREELEKIPGVGPYTVGAILSFAFHKKAAAVDGNVVRVLARFAAVEEDVTSGKFKKWIWEYAESILPETAPWLVVEGLIELGGTVCTRQPKCFACPLSSSCLGLKKGIADLLPIKKKQAATTQLKRQVAIVYCAPLDFANLDSAKQSQIEALRSDRRSPSLSGKGKNEDRFGEVAASPNSQNLAARSIMSGEFFLLRKGEKGNLMADLYEFPYVEGEEGADLKALLTRTFRLDAKHVEDCPVVQHSFTRYRATLYPSIWQAAERIEIQGFEWVEASELSKLPFSAGHRKIIHALKNRYAHITY